MAEPATAPAESNPPRLLRQWRVWAGIAISAGFLWWAFRQTEDIGMVVQSLRNANYLYLIPEIVAFFVGIWFRTLRWQILLSPIERIGLVDLYRIMAIGFTVNDVLPARLGEFARAFLLSRRSSLGKSAVLATIVVERVFDGITMFILLAVVGLATGLGSEVGFILQLAGAIFGGAALALVGMALAPEFTLRFIAFLLTPFPLGLHEKVLSRAEKFIGGLAVLQSPRLVALILATSVIAWGFEATMYILIGQGFGLGVGISPYLLTLAIVNLGTMVPSSPGYVGTFQGLAVLSLGFFGLSKELALGYSFVLHAALLLPVTLLGFYFLGRYNLSLRSILRE